MSQVTIAASYSEGVQNQNSNYYTCRNATSGFSICENVCTVGQWQVSAEEYSMYRGFLYFDTSGIPANAIITAAVINFTHSLADDESNTDFNIIIRGASSASNPLVLGDYDLTHYTDNLGELTTLGDYLHYTLNISGCLYINKGGLTKFVLLSEEDINNDPPIGNEFIFYESILSYIELTVTYFEPTTAPTVTTIDNACKDRQSTTLTATGDITSTGDGYTYRGFEYYEKGANLEYLDSMYAVREIGTFHVLGEFEMTLTGLKPNTIYYIRAVAGNIFGIAYGDWVLCSTTEVPSYDIYTEPFAGTYKLYVSDDEAIAWRGYLGPYTGKQRYVNLTKITNLTKGVKVLKIVPTGKASFHVCITVKQTLKS